MLLPSPFIAPPPLSLLCPPFLCPFLSYDTVSYIAVGSLRRQMKRGFRGLTEGWTPRMTQTLYSADSSSCGAARLSVRSTCEVRWRQNLYFSISKASQTLHFSTLLPDSPSNNARTPDTSMCSMCVSSTVKIMSPCTHTQLA